MHATLPVHTSDEPDPDVEHPALQEHVAALLLLELNDGQPLQKPAVEALYDPDMQPVKTSSTTAASEVSSLLTAKQTKKGCHGWVGQLPRQVAP